MQVPVLSGGRGPAERITLTPLGDEPVPRADPDQPWPGQLPGPSPAVLLDDPVELLDAQGNSVRVTSRGMFSADPARLTSRGRDDRLRWWAGPWPVDERWWDPDVGKGRTARAQVLLEGRARAAALLPTAAVVPGRNLRVRARRAVRPMPGSERPTAVDEPVEERHRVDVNADAAHRVLGAAPDQSVTVMPRVRVPVSSTSTVAWRVTMSLRVQRDHRG